MAGAGDCLFCSVVRGDLPSHVVLEDDLSVAFLDTSPAARGHTLVVPRTHAEDLWDIDAQTAAAVMRTAHATAGLLRERLAPDGLTLRQNNGEASGQRVAHLHLHLVPRWHGDGTVGWPWPPPVDLDLTEVLAALRP
ncbi:MAG TPA: HIT family protein [Mycobacteriales bacterium]|nr:HIT family protein [Mycobacteriales bacterium]